MTKTTALARWVCSALAVLAAGLAAAADEDWPDCAISRRLTTSGPGFHRRCACPVEEGATHGHKALAITFRPPGAVSPGLPELAARTPGLARNSMRWYSTSSIRAPSPCPGPS